MTAPLLAPSRAAPRPRGASAGAGAMHPCRIPPHVVHAIAVLRGVGVAARPLDDGEAQALAVIYRAYGGMLRAVLRALLPGDADADDVLHDVFCALPSAIPHYRDGRFGGWLRQVAVRAALMRLRAERARAERVEHVPEPAADATTARDLEALEDREALARALAGLSEPLRRVVVLRMWMDYTHQEIAEALGISASASEVRLCRALKQLRGVMRGEACKEIPSMRIVAAPSCKVAPAGTR